MYFFKMDDGCTHIPPPPHSNVKNIPVRPALPFLCSALALLTQNSLSRSILHTGSYVISFTLPESHTNLTPSMVTEVSAMFVLTIAFLYKCKN